MLNWPEFFALLIFCWGCCAPALVQESHVRAQKRLARLLADTDRRNDR